MNPSQQPRRTGRFVHTQLPLSDTEMILDKSLWTVLYLT